MITLNPFRCSMFLPLKEDFGYSFKNLHKVTLRFVSSIFFVLLHYLELLGSFCQIIYIVLFYHANPLWELIMFLWYCKHHIISYWFLSKGVDEKSREVSHNLGCINIQKGTKGEACGCREIVNVKLEQGLYVKSFH